MTFKWSVPLEAKPDSLVFCKASPHLVASHASFLEARCLFLGAQKGITSCNVLQVQSLTEFSRPLIGGTALMGVVKYLANGQRRAVGSYFAGDFSQG